MYGILYQSKPVHLGAKKGNPKELNAPLPPTKKKEKKVLPLLCSSIDTTCKNLPSILHVQYVLLDTFVCVLDCDCHARAIDRRPGEPIPGSGSVYLCRHGRSRQND